jgi:hypothetical protein
MVAERSRVVSSFTHVKGALIDETYAVSSAWDFSVPKKVNLDRLRDTNFIGAKSQTWLRDVAKVLNRRFDVDGADRHRDANARGGPSHRIQRPAAIRRCQRQPEAHHGVDRGDGRRGPPASRFSAATSRAATGAATRS